MLNRLLELLTKPPEEAVEFQPERLRLATCVVLLEVAGADSELSPEECSRIINILRERFELSQEEAEDLIQSSQVRRGDSYDLWKFTRQINDSCSVPEKLEIIEEVWRIIYADGALDAHEDFLAHKLAKLLNLNHPQLIEAKVKVLNEIRGEN